VFLIREGETEGDFVEARDVGREIAKNKFIRTIKSPSTGSIAINSEELTNEDAQNRS
jgi:hypothetical protein